MAEVMVSLSCVLTLQEKINTSLQASGKTMFGKMIDMFPSPSNTENSAHDVSKLSRKGNTRNPSLKVFKFANLKKATNHFSQDMLLGTGEYGEVFLGWVDKNTFAHSIEGVGIAVAVERYKSVDHAGVLERWQKEVSISGWLDHPNIIRLLGYSEDKKTGNLLVYEFMRNQTLYHFLHGGDAKPLLWGARLRIMIGLARGLAYMHSLKDQVIHGDVKSKHILLAQYFNAKLMGLGAAISGPGIRRTDVTTRVIGTFGYVDPEYMITGRVSVRSDIYSFGVVLLEILTGQQAVFYEQPEHERLLTEWASACLTDTTELKKMMDPRLEQNYSIDDAFECATLALRCVAKDPKDRPSSEEVLQSLGRIYAHGDSKLSSTGNSTITSLKVFKFADLKKATNHFSQDLLLGRRHDGDVFLGWVDKNTFAPSTEGVGIAVAVKRSNEDQLDESTLERWQTKINILGWLDHPNIIHLLGYSVDKQPQRLIVYEYMQNQNLHRFLHGDVAEPLSWATRLMIMIGVAGGLAYMHSSKYQVIHRDVRSYKILLDQDFNAKLGAFGDAKFGPEIGDTHITTLVHGTPGYVDPEYMYTSQLTQKSDVYSFGMVLLETLTGQNVFDGNRPHGEEHLIRWASSFLTEGSELEKIMDPRLQQNYSLQGAFECATLASRCLALHGSDRPSSEEVLQTLEQIYAVNT